MLSMQLAEIITLRCRTIELIEGLNKNRAIRKPSERLESAFKKYFKAQGRMFGKEFEKYRNRFPESFLADDEVSRIIVKIQNQISEPLKKVIQDETATIVQKAATDRYIELGMGDISMSFTLQNPAAQQYLETHSAALVSGVDDVTKAKIRKILTDAGEANMNYGQVAQELKNNFDYMRIGKPQMHIASRAHFIATNEARVAYEVANQAAAMSINDAGIEIEKLWSTMGDDRVSDGCASNQQDGYIPIKDQHTSGDTEPPRFPGCRCDEYYQRKKDTDYERALLKKYGII